MSATFSSVWFDCDSTLATIEGIDELARFAPADIRERIAGLTDQAMDGTISVEEVYGRRLELLRPTRDEVAAIGAAYCENLVADTAAVVAALQFLGKPVGIISGGLLPPVLAVADRLGIEHARVHAVGIDFDSDGAYAGFDATSPMTRNGGKPDVLVSLDAALRPLAFVGDGVTDLEAASVIERFIGFGGVCRRDRVVAGAEFFADGPSLATVLQFCLTSSEIRRLGDEPRFAALIP